jgi:hypothetical protein
MMRALILFALLVPLAAYAQTPPLQQQVDSAVANTIGAIGTITNTIAILRGQVAQDQEQIAALQAKLAAATVKSVETPNK